MESVPDQRYAPPALVFGLIDGGRALGELGWFGASYPWLRRQATPGDQPVLVLPGLNAGDWSTWPLRALLDSVGYRTYAWGLGTNVGPTRPIIEGLDALLEQIHQRHGRPVSLVGQSLGGYLGAELARRHPEQVDRLISLGGPMVIQSLRQSRAGHTYRRHHAEHVPDLAFERWRQAPRPELPSTSIYSRSDGVVHWSACRYPETPLTENIEVCSSHLGMAVHPAAVYAVLDRLAAPVENWKKFSAPRHLRAYFPTPKETSPTWEPDTC